MRRLHRADVYTNEHFEIENNSISSRISFSVIIVKETNDISIAVVGRKAVKLKDYSCFESLQTLFFSYLHSTILSISLRDVYIYIYIFFL